MQVRPRVRNSHCSALDPRNALRVMSYMFRGFSENARATSIHGSEFFRPIPRDYPRSQHRESELVRSDSIRHSVFDRAYQAFVLHLKIRVQWNPPVPAFPGKRGRFPIERAKRKAARAFYAWRKVSSRDADKKVAEKPFASCPCAESLATRQESRSS